MVRLKCVFWDVKCLIWQWLKGKKLTLRWFFFFKAELHICFDLFYTRKSKIKKYVIILSLIYVLFSCCYSIPNSLCLFFFPLSLSLSLWDTHTHTNAKTSCGHVVTNGGDEKRFHADRMSGLSGRWLTSESIKEERNQLHCNTAFLQGMQIWNPALPVCKKENKHNIFRYFYCYI